MKLMIKTNLTFKAFNKEERNKYYAKEMRITKLR